MNKKNILNLIIATALIFSSCQSKVDEEKNDAVFKSIKKVYTLNEDGSVNYRYQHELKYNTHLAFNRLYGESFIVYNPIEQELKINKAETKTMDGRIVPSPENAFNEVLPRFASGAPAFNHLREMVVTHTGLELGCTVFFDYEVKSNKGYIPFLSDNILLQEKMPVENMEIVIKVPEGSSLHYKLLHNEAAVKETSKDGFKLYTWKFKDIAAVSTDAYQSHDKNSSPKLVFSSVDLKEALSHITENTDLTLSNEMKLYADKRVAGKNKSMEIVRELQKIVGTEMNSYHIPIEHTGYDVRPLKEVWKSNGATDLEKVFILNELIKNAGIESKVLLALGNDSSSKEIVSLNRFGHYFIMADIEGEQMVLSVSPKQKNSLAFNISNNIVVDLQAEEVLMPDYISKTDNGCIFQGRFDLTEEGTISGTVNAKVSGKKNPYINYLIKEENAKETVASLFPGTKIKNVEVISFDKKQSEVSATIEGEEVWKENGDYYFMHVPSSTYGIKGEHLSTLLQKRETPLHLGQKVSEVYDFKVSIPEGFIFIAPKVKKEISNVAGSVSVEIAYTENSAHVKKTLKINKQDIAVSEYAGFKHLVDFWNKKTNNELIFKKQVVD